MNGRMPGVGKRSGQEDIPGAAGTETSHSCGDDKPNIRAHVPAWKGSPTGTDQDKNSIKIRHQERLRQADIISQGSWIETSCPTSLMSACFAIGPSLARAWIKCSRLMYAGGRAA